MIALLPLILVACGGDAGNGIRGEIAQDLFEGSEGMISEEEASCAADVIVDVLGEEQAEMYAAAMSGDLEAASEMDPPTPEQQTAMAQGFQECDLSE